MTETNHSPERPFPRSEFCQALMAPDDSNTVRRKIDLLHLRVVPGPDPDHRGPTENDAEHTATEGGCEKLRVSRRVAQVRFEGGWRNFLETPAAVADAAPVPKSAKGTCGCPHD